MCLNYNTIQRELIVILFTSLLLLSSRALTQDMGFIFGEITTKDSISYIGQIRWGNEEIFWTDYFNAIKIGNPNINLLSEKDKERFESYYKKSRKLRDRPPFQLSYQKIHQHIFICQFGDILSITPKNNNEAEIVLKGEIALKLKAYSNDLRSDLNILDSKKGLVSINWPSIAHIKFYSPSNTQVQTFGNPLYGKVETLNGTFKGYIQWDHEERITTDKLDGNSEKGREAIVFEQIKSVQKITTNKCVVILNSGRQIALKGSGDVNSNNNGIVVTNIDGFGRVDIPWDKFKTVSFQNYSEDLKAYSEFTVPHKINGTVKMTTKEIINGDIIFDLDETYDLEILSGMNNRIEHYIPFRLINKLERNGDQSQITLQNGNKLTLNGRQDVSEKNSGLIVFDAVNKNSKYITWDEVEEIDFHINKFL